MSNHSKQTLMGNVLKKQACFVHVTFFCSEVFKTTSNVLNSNVNIVNIALIAFCSVAATNVAHWAMSNWRQWNARYQNPEKAKTNDNCVTNYMQPASNPDESKGGEIRYKILQLVVQHCFIASFGLLFRVFHLVWSTCHATKIYVCWSFDVGWGNLLRKVERRSTFN